MNNMQIALLTTDDVPNILEELEAAFYDIPFENSDFQNRAFVIASQQTPARAYRAIGLKMMSKIRAIKDYLFEQEKLKIDIEEKQAKLEDPDINEFEKRRLRLEIAKIEDGRSWGKKLMNDALHELTVLKAELDKFPKYTREQFEAEEALHFEMRLKRQLEAPGAMESLLNMKEDMKSMPDRIAIAASQIQRLSSK